MDGTNYYLKLLIFITRVGIFETLLSTTIWKKYRFMYRYRMEDNFSTDLPFKNRIF